MIIKNFIIHRLVKYDHLNHHGTLFAGQCAEWFVESGFIAAASLTKPENVVCVNVHGMIFKKSVSNGTILCCESKIVFAGRTKLIAYVRFENKMTGDFIVDGFLTFVHVDENGRPIPHGIVVEAADENDRMLQETAKNLPALQPMPSTPVS